MMDELIKKELAEFLYNKIEEAERLQEYFDAGDIECLIGKFFEAKDLIEERSAIQRKIDDILK